MANPWTIEEISFLRDSVTMPTKAVYEIFVQRFPVRTYDSIQKKFKKVREAYEPTDVETAEVNIPATFLLLDDNKARKKKNADKVMNFLEGVVEAGRDINVPKVSASQGDKDSLVVVLSDLHFGKRTPWFSLEEASRRLLSIPTDLYKKFQWLEIDEIVVTLVGDLVEGEDIYAGQANDLDCPVIMQVETATKSIWKMLSVFTKLFGKPVKVYSVPGNHGRMSKTASGLTNWDNQICNNLALMSGMSDLDIQVEQNLNAFKRFRVKDKVGLLYHHGVKHTSTPATRDKVGGWVMSKEFDFLIHGHWHEWHVGNWLGRMVVGNGCMCGPDDLAERMGKEDYARQAYFLVTPGKPLWGFGYIEWPHEEPEDELPPYKEEHK